MSATETETLRNLIENRVKAAACDETPAERTHLVLFNPTTRQFASWLIPNAEPGSLLPNEPADIQNLQAAGFVVLCKIPEYQPEAEPKSGRGHGPGSGVWDYLKREDGTLVLCGEPQTGEWRRHQAWMREAQAELETEQTIEALVAGMSTSEHKRIAWSEELENEGSATLSSPFTLREVCKVLRR